MTDEAKQGPPQFIPKLKGKKVRVRRADDTSKD